MTELSDNQEELRQSIQKSAITWAVVLGVLAALVAFWTMGSLDGAMRLGGAVILGGGAGFAIYRWIFNSRAKAAKCEKCNAAFSTSRSDREETLVSSELKEEREPQDDGSIKVSRWTEEKFDVVDTYTCSNCAHVTTKEHQTTRRKDEESIVEPAPVAAAASSDKSSSLAASKTQGTRKRPARKSPAKSKRTDSDSTRQ